MPLAHDDVHTGRDSEGRKPKGKKQRPRLQDIITWQEEANQEQSQRPVRTSPVFPPFYALDCPTC